MQMINKDPPHRKPKMSLFSRKQSNYEELLARWEKAMDECQKEVNKPPAKIASLVYLSDVSLEKLNEKIKEHITQGYQPHGELVINQTMDHRDLADNFIQCMVLYFDNIPADKAFEYINFSRVPNGLTMISDRALLYGLSLPTVSDEFIEANKNVVMSSIVDQAIFDRGRKFQQVSTALTIRKHLGNHKI